MKTNSIAAAALVCLLVACASDEDPYLWLEEVQSQRALDWVREQNARSLPQLERDARFAGLYDAALEIAQSNDRFATGEVRDGYLYNFWQDQEHVRGVWRRSPLTDYARGAPHWRTLLDLDALAAHENANWVFKEARCLAGSTRCMISLSEGGRDASTWREFDVETREFIANGFTIPAAKSNLAWIDRDTLLVGTDWGDGTQTNGGYTTSLRTWRRNAPLDEAHEIVRGQTTDVGMFATVMDDGAGVRLPLAVQAHSFHEFDYWRLDGAAPARINLPTRARLLGLHHGHLIATLDESWRGLPQGALITYPLTDTNADAPRAEVLFAPNARQAIGAQSLIGAAAITRDAVLVAYLDNVRGRLLRVALENGAWRRDVIEFPSGGSISFAGASATESLAFAVFQDHLTPPTLYAIDDRASRIRPIRALAAQFDAQRFVAEQYEATSRDGTRVPYFVVRPRDLRFNGDAPTLLTGYGGFQAVLAPAYNPNVGRLWLERGGVYVIANIRGGGEFGPAWHQAALGVNRELVYDDFYAVERDLIDRRITRPRRLGIQGVSSGGLLMAVMLNQHPEMVNAAVIGAPLTDMLRFDRLLAGATWIGEYGSPSIPEQRAYLQQTSPYHNLRRRADFPRPFIYTSTNDDRVHPAHARKYAARLDELGMPYLYYENTDGGHAGATDLSESARHTALIYTYLHQQLSP